MPDLHNTPPPPPPVAGPHIPVQISNPFAAPSKPVNVGSVAVSSSMIPSTVKRHTTSQVETKTTTKKNPIAASLVSELPSTPQIEQESFVPGPQLRFTLVPYGEQDSDDEVPPPPPPEPSKDDKDLADFMASIANM